MAAPAKAQTCGGEDGEEGDGLLPTSSSKSPLFSTEMQDLSITTVRPQARRMSRMQELLFRPKRKKKLEKSADSFASLVLNDVCLIEESPMRIFWMAGSGNLAEVERLYNQDRSRLCLQDSKGRTPLHVAATKGQLTIMHFIVQHGGDMNARDQDGNTALHLAILASQPAAITLLVEAGADTTLTNAALLAPLHLATDLGDVEALKALVQCDKVDINLRGEVGMNALHYAAAKNRAECAKLLLENGCMPCVKCDYGFYPIHVAAKCAAAETMEAIILHAMSHGYTREQIMSFKDKENNMPLHSAVNGGVLKVVEVCLKAGALVNTQQEDLSTPLHFACAQGNLEMIELMHTMQPTNFLQAVHTTDVLGMTPLHRAALFNHTAAVHYLLKSGADINAKDLEQRTPLLLAATKGGWATVRTLLDDGADIAVKDRNNRNFLHLAIKFGGKLTQYGCEFIKDVKNLLNESDDFGCTPLHYATKEGHLLAIDDLLRLGAVISPKNNDKQSPFHFAARYGRYNTCKRLLDSEQGSNIINETDGEGKTALHIAAMNGHTRVLSLLLQKGAALLRDNDFHTPLHYAAANGYTQSIRLLLGVHANLLDAINNQGETPLHLAAKNGCANVVTLLMTLGAEFRSDMNTKTFFDNALELKHAEVAMAAVKHDRWEEVLSLNCEKYDSPITGLIQQLPEVCMVVLDRCVSKYGKNKNDPSYYIEYNFKYLQCCSNHHGHDDEKEKEKEKEKPRKDDHEHLPLAAMNAMVKNGRVDLLSHPVCVNYLQMKWRAYGMWVYTLYLSVYGVFMICQTSFVMDSKSFRHYDPSLCPNQSCLDNQTWVLLHGNVASGYQYPIQDWARLLVMTVYAGINIIKEVIQMILQKKRYFTELGNALEWSLYLTTLLFVTPFLFGLSQHYQWEAGAMAVFLAWFNCLVFLQNFDFFGIYVVMFLEILKTLLQVLCVFFFLIVAFSLAFFMLLYNEESQAYSTPWLSLMRTGMMMLELDYMESFNKPFTDGLTSTLHFDNLSLFFLALFVLLMPILLMNLLIGLAVGDIEAVQRNARLKRLAMQVELHTDMERKIPERLLYLVDKQQYRHYPNKCDGLIRNWFVMIMKSDDLNGDYFTSSVSPCSRSLNEEMHKQKIRMKELSTQVSKSHELLRLIVQKMEIQTEDEVWDEGLSSSDSVDSLLHAASSPVSKPSRRLPHGLLAKTAAIATLKKSLDKS